MEIGGVGQGSDGVPVATSRGASDGRDDIGVPVEIRTGHDLIVGIEVKEFVIPRIKLIEVKHDLAAITTEAKVAPAILAISFDTVGKEA